MRTIMTTVILKNALLSNSETNPTDSRSSADVNLKMSTFSMSTLEERKGNVVKPLSLRPNRSFKKNSSLKPLGLKSRQF